MARVDLGNVSVTLNLHNNGFFGEVIPNMQFVPDCTTNICFKQKDSGVVVYCATPKAAWDMLEKLRTQMIEAGYDPFTDEMVQPTTVDVQPTDTEYPEVLDEIQEDNF